MQVGNLVRQMLEEHNIVNTRLAFFLHIPFPPWDIFRLFPWHDVILVGMLGCDLIGFHVEGYVDNFLECCQKGLGCQVDRDRCLVSSHSTAFHKHSIWGSDWDIYVSIWDHLHCKNSLVNCMGGGEHFYQVITGLTTTWLITGTSRRNSVNHLGGLSI